MWVNSSMLQWKKTTWQNFYMYKLYDKYVKTKAGMMINACNVWIYDKLFEDESKCVNRYFMKWGAGMWVNLSMLTRVIIERKNRFTKLAYIWIHDKVCENKSRYVRYVELCKNESRYVNRYLMYVRGKRDTYPSMCTWVISKIEDGRKILPVLHYFEH